MLLSLFFAFFARRRYWALMSALPIDLEAFDAAPVAREPFAFAMVPRFVRVVEALPRTPTAKIEKVKLRAEGLTPDTWDREAAGIAVKREKIGREKIGRG